MTGDPHRACHMSVCVADHSTPFALVSHCQWPVSQHSLKSQLTTHTLHPLINATSILSTAASDDVCVQLSIIPGAEATPPQPAPPHPWPLTPPQHADSYIYGIVGNVWLQLTPTFLQVGCSTLGRGFGVGWKSKKGGRGRRGQ